MQRMYTCHNKHTHTGYFKHAHVMQKYILQQNCNNLILLLWTYEKEMYVFVRDGDEDDVNFFFPFFFSTMPPIKEGATVVNEKKQCTDSLLNQEGRTHWKLPSPKCLWGSDKWEKPAQHTECHCSFFFYKHAYKTFISRLLEHKWEAARSSTLRYPWQDIH